MAAMVQLLHNYVANLAASAANGNQALGVGQNLLKIRLTNQGANPI